MALADAYLTVDEFKARTRSSSSANDDAIGAALLAASRQIDQWTGRQFGQDDAPTERVFPNPDLSLYPAAGWPFPGWKLAVDDYVSLSAIATDPYGFGTFETVWDLSEFVNTPQNAPQRGEPYTELWLPPLKPISFAVPIYGVRVTGVWGWPSVPPQVTEACFLIANRLKSLWDAPFGLSGGGEMGALDMTVSLTPIIKEMLAPYRVMAL